ncbi:MAG: hypothetical protein EOP04_25885, partial [Proteobacteria bacterium]
MSYDPGRYYYAATWMKISGSESILSLRDSIAFIQCIGTAIALTMLARSLKIFSLPYLIVSAIILVTWMFPRHKLFDITFSIINLFTIYLLIERPSLRRFFFIGTAVGLMALFGRNHSLYLGFAVCLSLMFAIKNDPFGRDSIKKCLILVLGVLSGFLPLLAFVIFVPGFARQYWDSVIFIVEIKTTNLTLPIPWPWLVSLKEPMVHISRSVLIGLFFLISATFTLSTIWPFFRSKFKTNVSPLVISCCFLSLPYAHFAFSRADVGHLAQGVFPTLLALLVVIGNFKGPLKAILVSIILVSSAWVMAAFHPASVCYVSKDCRLATLGNEEILMENNSATEVSVVQKFAEIHAKSGQNLMFAPYWPGAYALLDQRSPTWEIYALFPRPADFESKEIDRMKSSN